MRNQTTISSKCKAIFIMLAAALLASCENLISRKPQEIIDRGGV